MGTKLALLVAVVLGFLAMLGVRSWMKGEEKELRQQFENVAIAVAVRNLKKGEALTARDFKSAFLPKIYVLKGMIPAGEVGTHNGKILQNDLEEGYPLFRHMAGNRHSDTTTNNPLVAEDTRAVTISVDPIKGVAGLIRPGDYVDIVATFERPESGPARRGGGSSAGGASTVSVFLMQNVKVIALDNRTLATSMRTRQAMPYRTVTLEVSPRDAVRLVSATNQGEIQLLLRRFGNTKVEEGTDAQSGLPTRSWDIIKEAVSLPSHVDN